MILVELALQGVRGFPSLLRLPLKPGLNVARSNDRATRACLVDALYHTLYPDSARAGATAAMVASGASESRIAITFYGRDRVTYRLIRDAQTGATRLYRFDPATKKHKLFTSTSAEALQYLRVQQQLPDEVSYERLFLYAPESMPARGAKARTRSGAPLANGIYDVAPSGPGLPQTRFASGMLARPGSLVAPSDRSLSALGRAPSQISGPETGFGSALNMNNALVQSEFERREAGEPEPDDHEDSQVDKRKALERMRTDLHAVLKSEQAQTELDQLSLRKFELTERGERVGKLRREVEALEQKSKQEQQLEGLPPGFGERLQHYSELQARYEGEREKLTLEHHQIQDQSDRFVVMELKDDRYFVAGVLSALFCFALAIGLQKPSISLFNLLCALVAVGAAFRWVADREEKTRLGLRVGAASERLARLERQHNLDTGVTARLMDTLDIDSPADLLARYEVHHALLEQIREGRAALAALLADPEIARADRELKEVNLRMAALEVDVMGATGSLLSAETVERRIHALERELGEPISPPIPRPASRAPPRARSVVGEGVIPPLFVAQDVMSRATRAEPLPRGPSVVGTPVREPLRAPPPRPASVPADDPAKHYFDFGGGDIGDDDEEDGYGAGYDAGGGGSSSGGVKTAGVDGLWATGMIGGGGGFRSGPGGYGEDAGYVVPDRSRDLVQAAVDMLQIEIDELGRSLSTRLGQFLSAFTDERYDRAELGPRGEISVFPVGGSDPVGFMELEGDALDQVDAAVRFALVETVVRRYRIPIIVDDPFEAFPRKKRQILSQMLGYLARSTQVVVLTSHDDISGHPLTW